MMMRVLAAVIVWVNLSLPAFAADLDETRSLPVRYIGNSFSQKFHIPSCPFAQAMWRRRRLEFHFRHEATELGFRPCCWCLPKRWKHLEGRILTVELPVDECPKLVPNGSSTN